MQHGGTGQNRWKRQLLGGEDLGWDLPKDRSAAVFLLEEVGSEASHSWKFISKIHIARLLEVIFFIAGSNLVQHVSEVVIGQHTVTLQSFQFTMDAKDWFLSGDQM